MVGNARHIRTVPVPGWVKTAIDSWLASAGVSEGRAFRCVCPHHQISTRSLGALLAPQGTPVRLPGSYGR
jgi:hypothetical protein